MSNYLAIATVTATLGSLLYTAAVQDVTDTQVVVNMLRPADIAKDPAAETNANINIYLYQVTPNAAYRNSDLPTRRSDGTILQRPQVALDLHYIISFYGHESDYVTHRLLGSVVRTLHAEPQLTRERIRATLPTVVVNGKQILRDSDLADQVELVKFAPLHLSLEEFSRIWSVFYQIPYVLSVAYQASVVLIEEDISTQNALPVLTRNIYALPFNQPIIEHITTEEDAKKPSRQRIANPFITLDSTLQIEGKRLQGEDVTLVQIGNVELLPDNVTDAKIMLPLTTMQGFREDGTMVSLTDALRAGIQGLQVIHKLSMGMDKPIDQARKELRDARNKLEEAQNKVPQVPNDIKAAQTAIIEAQTAINNRHRGVESNVAAFVLRPAFTADPTFDAGKVTVTVKLKPVVNRPQRIVLLLNDFSPALRQPGTPSARAYSFIAKPLDQTWKDSSGQVVPKNDPSKFSDQDSTDTITFSTPGVVPGTYLARVQVDGAESILEVDTDKQSLTFNRYIKPQVVIQ